MKLDATDLRYVTADEFRVLTATEIGSKNHEVVPSALIAQISGIRDGNVNKMMGQLAKRGLIARVQNAKYDGYRLTYGGLDYLALRTFSRKKPASVYSVGKQIGVGKESDIHVVQDEEGQQRVLKMHRLGRISFRAIKSKRDYLGKRKSASWMYMSRLAAQKEFAFMKVLYENDFPVPIPIDQARHCIVMSLIDSYPLRQISTVESPNDLYAKLMALIVRLARAGLIHGDFNEFNILIGRKDGEPVVIDFPQMVSTRHENAEYFFNRDVNCIRKFFKKRFRFESKSWPTWKDIIEEEEELDEEEAAAPSSNTPLDSADPEGEALDESRAGVDEPEVATDAEAEGVQPESSGAAVKRRLRLDLEVEASGFGRAMQRELEDYMIEVQDLPESNDEDDEADTDSDEEEEDEDEDEEDADGQEPITNDKEEFDEVAFQQQVSDRLESLRLNKALGNDDPDSSSDPNPHLEPESDSDTESDSSSNSSANGSKPPPSDYTSYAPSTRNTRKHYPRLATKQLEDIDELRITVEKQVGKEKRRNERLHHGGAKGVGTVGRAKGHKWKSSGSYLVGKSGDGW